MKNLTSLPSQQPFPSWQEPVITTKVKIPPTLKTYTSLKPNSPIFRIMEDYIQQEIQS